MQSGNGVKNVYQAAGFSTGTQLPFTSVAIPVEKAANRDPNAALEIFRLILPQIKQQTGVPILLPTELLLTLPPQTVYLNGRGQADEYRLVLALTADCSGASACVIGSFEGKRGGKPYPNEFSKTVKLSRGLTGYASPMFHGAATTAPGIGWQSGEVFYRIYLKVNSRNPTEDEINAVKVANSAIDAGPR